MTAQIFWENHNFCYVIKWWLKNIHSILQTF